MKHDRTHLLNRLRRVEGQVRGLARMLETGALDSSAARISWNPSAHWSLQASWADIISPEALELDIDETRRSATASYAASGVSATLGLANKERSDGASLNAWMAEAALHPSQAWTIFGRAERAENAELAPGSAHTVSRLSLGAVHDWRIGEHARFGLGALVEHHLTPDALEPAYGGDPNGAMGFVRLKIG